MLSIAKLGLLLAVLSVVTACGGSGGSAGGSTGVSVSPSGAQVLAGASQQMTAIASDGGMAFTWQINGVTGGNSSLGTISASGLYTAPNLPPAGGKVTITAVEQGGAGASGSALLNIAFSNASLGGAYVFDLSGFNQGASWFATGEFSANSAGQLSNGLQDTNNGATVQTKSAFTGSYSINPDGSGSLVLGNLQFQLVMQASGSAFLVSTSSGTTIIGSLSAQDSAAGSINSLSGPLVLSISGTIGNQGFNLLALANVGSGGTLSGFEDVNGPNPLIRAAFTGSYAFDGNNHGTLAIKDSQGTHNYSFYVESASDFLVQSADPAAPVNGSMSDQQAISYTNATLNGPFAFLINGNSTIQAYVQGGQFNPNGFGNLGTVTEDINTPGNLQTSLITTGTYAFDPTVNGRGTLTLNGQGSGAPQNYVFYMVSPQLADFMTANSSIVAGGLIVMQTKGSSFQSSSLLGAYGFALATQVSATSGSAAVGTLSMDGNGNLSGAMIQNLNGSVSSLLSLSGSYAISGVRGTATLTSGGGGSSPFAIYPVNPGIIFLIGTDSASPYFGIAISQN